MKRWILIGWAALMIVPGALNTTPAADGWIRLGLLDGQARVRIKGDADDDWHIERSGDLMHWVREPGLGPLLSGGQDAPEADLGPWLAGEARYYRARRTGGLYDAGLMRTIELTFTQANWASRLTSGRTTGSNTLGTLAMDNGASGVTVGARYKGNTSFTGFGGSAPAKKSINLQFDDLDASADFMGYETVNLNNAYGDETILREALYFNLMRHYTVCPKASLVRLMINGTYWGVYTLVQQEDGDLIREWFPSNDGDRWETSNAGGGGGGGGFGGGGSALSYLGTSLASYQSNYTLKSQKTTHAWQALMRATDVLNNTPAATLRQEVEQVLAVDRWLWFLAIENVVGDDDSYFNKGADYELYHEPESGRIHPIEHDGNESFVAADLRLSPVQGATSTTRPVLYKLLGVPELRQRYLAHMRTVLEESFRPDLLEAEIDRYRALSVDAIAADTKKGYTMAAYTNDMNALKSFIRQRHAFLTNHAELRPVPPEIRAVRGPDPAPAPDAPARIIAEVAGVGTNGVDSVWVYHRIQDQGAFEVARMLDDGAHGDGAAGDGWFGAEIPPYRAATRVRYYVEARSANAAKAARFSPARAERETHTYQVAIPVAPSTPVVLNELMASNASFLKDPQGDYDDWIELRNLTDQDVDLTGRYLSDDPARPTKWAFPEDTVIPANGFLIVWADEDGGERPGLHANFKLSAAGEGLHLIDTDARLNAVLDSIAFGAQAEDRSFGRSAADPEVWTVMNPTPGAVNP